MKTSLTTAAVLLHLDAILSNLVSRLRVCERESPLREINENFTVLFFLHPRQRLLCKEKEGSKKRFIRSSIIGGRAEKIPWSVMAIFFQ